MGSDGAFSRRASARKGSAASWMAALTRYENGYPKTSATPSERGLRNDAPRGSHQVVEREHRRSLRGGNEAVQESLPHRRHGGKGQAPHDERGDGDRKARRLSDNGEANDAHGRADQEDVRAPRENATQKGHREAAEDLRAGDDGGCKPRHAERGLVAVELEKIRLQRVEGVHADPVVNGADSMSQRTGGFRHPSSSEARATRCISVSRPLPRSGVNPRSFIKKNAATNVSPSRTDRST